jgi:hypothetical protein
MARFLNSCPIAICDRCSMKFPWKDLRPDGNSPGLMVCAADYDPRNPWRERPIRPDRIALKWSRPDVPLNAGIRYRDFTNPPNPSPPNYFFYEVEGMEGGGVVGDEDGSLIAFEPTTFEALENGTLSGLEDGRLIIQED